MYVKKGIKEKTKYKRNNIKLFFLVVLGTEIIYNNSLATTTVLKVENVHILDCTKFRHAFERNLLFVCSYIML